MGAWEELEWRERAGGLMYKVLNFLKKISLYSSSWNRVNTQLLSAIIRVSIK